MVYKAKIKFLFSEIKALDAQIVKSPFMELKRKLGLGPIRLFKTKLMSMDHSQNLWAGRLEIR